MKTKSPLRYAGGKSKAIKYIAPHMEGVKKIISPFMGGASLEIYLCGSGAKVIGFDVFDILINYWKVQLNQPNELYDILNTFEPTKEKYNEIKSLLKKWNKSQALFSQLATDYYKDDSIELSALQGAAYYWFNHNLSFGPMYMGWMSSIYVNDKTRYEACIDRVKSFACPNLTVDVGSFEETIPAYKKEFMYLDPPYYLGEDEDNKMFKGIYPNPNYDIHHTGFNHEKLRDLLHSHKGGFVLSYNNCKTIREWYWDFDMHYPKWMYSYGQGETRIGKNKAKNNPDNNPKESHEILIIKK